MKKWIFDWKIFKLIDVPDKLSIKQVADHLEVVESNLELSDRLTQQRLIKMEQMIQELAISSAKIAETIAKRWK